MTMDTTNVLFSIGGSGNALGSGGKSSASSESSNSSFQDAIQQAVSSKDTKNIKDARVQNEGSSQKKEVKKESVPQETNSITENAEENCEISQQDALALLQMALAQLSNMNIQTLEVEDAPADLQEIKVITSDIPSVLTESAAAVIEPTKEMQENVQTVQESNINTNAQQQPIIFQDVLQQKDTGNKVEAVVDNAEVFVDKKDSNTGAEKITKQQVRQVSEQAEKTGLEDVQVVTQKAEKTDEEPVLLDFVQTPKTDTIQVKVGDAVQVNEGNFAENIAEKVIVKLPQNENEFVIELMPKELGKVTIKMVMEAGRTLVSMTSDNPKTLALLAENAKSIGMLIENNTGTQTIVNVQEEQDMYQQPEDSHENQQHQSQQEGNKKTAKTEEQPDFIQQMRLGLAQADGWDRSILS